MQILTVSIGQIANNPHLSLAPRDYFLKPKRKIKKYRIIECMGSCISPTIARMADKPGKKFSYKKACKMIKEFDPKFYYDLALDFYNPWEDNTNIKKGNILHIVHSQNDYLFRIEEVLND